MANEIKLTLKVNDDGSLDLVAKKAKEAGAATEKLEKATKKTNKARSNYNKVEKGVGNMTSNTTKAFSKQTGVISGGLVPAYAVLAANIFAITAAFGALQRAAQVEQLTAGLTALGRASGLAMQTLSQGLVEATGNALSLEEAMRSTALITSAGLDPSSIQRFGEVAKNASIALGRDTADSLARLTRGVTKLEPELLDELGIMVRIDEATQDFAAALGKSASELSNFEKRQAFMNAALEEGDRKFKAIGDSVDTNPFDKLAATFNNLQKTILGFLNTAITPLVSFLASSPVALLGVLTAFAGTVIGKMVPALEDLSANAKATSDNTKELAKSSLGSVKGLKNLSPAVAAYAKALEEGNATDDQFKSAQRGSKDAVRKRTKALNEATGGQRAFTAIIRKGFGDTQQEINLIKERSRVLKEGKKIQDVFIRNTFLEKQAKLQSAQASIVANLSQGNFNKGLKDAAENIKDQAKNIKVGIANSSALGAVNIFVAGTFGILGSAATFASAAIARIAPILTIISIAFAIIAPIFTAIRNLFKDPAIEAYKEKSESLANVQKELSVNLKEVDDAFQGQSKTIQGLAPAYTALSNILQQFQGEYKNLKNAAPEGSFDLQAEAIDNLVKNSDQLSLAFKEQFNGATSVSDLIGTEFAKNLGDATTAAEGFIETQEKGATIIKNISLAVKESATEFSNFINQNVPSTPLDNLAAATANIAGEIEKVDENFLGLADTINGFSSAQINIFGVQEESAAIKELTKELEEVQKRRAELEKGTTSNTRRGSRTKINTAAVAQAKADEKEIQESLEEQAAIAQALISQRNALIQKNRLDLATQKQLTNEIKADLELFKQRTIINADSRAVQLGLEEELRASEEKGLRTQLQFQESLKTGVTDATELAGINATIAELEGKILVIQGKKKTENEIQLELAKAEVTALKETQKFEKAVLDVRAQAVKASQDALKLQEAAAVQAQKVANLADQTRTTGATLTAADEFKINKELLASRIKAAADERDLKLDQLKIEEAMSKVQMEVVRAEARVMDARRAEQGLPDLQLEQSIVESITKMEGVREQQEQNINDAYTNRVNALNFEVNSLEGAVLTAIDRNKEETKLLDLVSKQVDARKELAKAQKEALDIQIQADKLSNTRIDGGVKSAVEAARIEATSRNNKLKAARVEHELLKAGIKAENDLLIAKFHLNVLEMAKDGLTEAEANLINAQAQVLGLQLQASEQTLKNSELKLANAEEELRIENQKAIVGAGAQQGVMGSIAQFQGTMIANAAGEGTAEEEAEKAKNRADAQKALTRGILEGVAEDMKKLGPEGEVVSVTISGALAISDAFTGAFETIKASGGDMAANMSAVLSAVSATIGQISQIQQAQARAGVAEIQKQIDIEKKRDGSSAKSMAKIKALEKKQDDMKRKAFEQDKKMKIAQAVSSTAAGMIGAFVGVTLPTLPLAIAQAAIIAAAGAASIAAISSTSYNGGASSAPKGPPKSVTMGNRSNVVDVSQRSRGSELAYLRGARGMGTNANDFTPAFYGSKKMRAVGGSVAGYTVGEQGPELFVPSVPGQIVPNDDVAPAQPINVNFNVQAIDSSSFNDALTVQRGNIISIIREAANGSGEGFLETVDVESLKMER